MPHVGRKTKITTKLSIITLNGQHLKFILGAIRFYKADVCFYDLFSYIALSTVLILSSCQVMLMLILEMFFESSLSARYHLLCLRSCPGLC